MTDKFEKLKELKQFLDEGAIDKEEYSKLKKELLDGEREDVSDLKSNDSQNASHCPKCGSSSIQPKTDTHTKTEQNKNINWGRAVVGWALLGPVGGAVGGLTGKQGDSTTSYNSNTYCYCLNCGSNWNPEELYQLKETIKNLTGLELNLSKENHRIYMDKFVKEINPLFDKLKSLEEHPSVKFTKAKQKRIDKKNHQATDSEAHLGALVLSFIISFIIVSIIRLFFSFNDDFLLIINIIIIIIIYILMEVVLVKEAKNEKRREEIKKQKILKEKETKIKEREELQKQIPEKISEFHNQHSHLWK